MVDSLDHLNVRAGRLCKSWVRGPLFSRSSKRNNLICEEKMMSLETGFTRCAQIHGGASIHRGNMHQLPSRSLQPPRNRPSIRRPELGVRLERSSSSSRLSRLALLLKLLLLRLSPSPTELDRLRPAHSNV